MNVPRQIKRARKQLKMTQVTLAKELHVHRTTLANYEIGRVEVPLALLKDLARVTGFSPAWFLLAEDERIASGPHPDVTLEEALDVLRSALPALQGELKEAKAENDRLRKMLRIVPVKKGSRLVEDGPDTGNPGMDNSNRKTG